ncbi:hypothetical protein N323_06130, partial [Cathartes aura]
MSSLVPSASPRRCRPGFLQLDRPSCWWQGEPRFVLQHGSHCGFSPIFFHISKHLFSKNSQQLSILK